MSARETISRVVSEAFTTNWPRTARFCGLLMGLAELGLAILPPHRPPDSGLLAFAGGLILVPNGVEAQRRRQRSREHPKAEDPDHEDQDGY